MSVRPPSASLPPRRSLRPPEKHYISRMRTSSTGRIVAFALVLGWLAPIAAHAEIISVPPADPPDAAASLPPPTVLRGSPPAAVRSVPICPPGYTVTADYGCVGPSGGDYTEGRARLRLLAGLRLRLSLRRVSRFRVRSRPLPSLCRVPWWPRFPRSGGFPRYSEVWHTGRGDGTYGRLRPQVNALPMPNQISAQRRGSAWNTAL